MKIGNKGPHSVESGSSRISRMALGLRHERATIVCYRDLDEAVEFVRATF